MVPWTSSCITGCGELICFRMVDELAMKWAVAAGLDEEVIRSLADGEYLARNLSSGALSRGRMALGS